MLWNSNEHYLKLKTILAHKGNHICTIMRTAHNLSTIIFNRHRQDTLENKDNTVTYEITSACTTHPSCKNKINTNQIQTQNIIYIYPTWRSVHINNVSKYEHAITQNIKALDIVSDDVTYLHLRH